MSQPEELDADARYGEWVDRIQRIKQETTILFWNRRLFRAVQRMFETNTALQRVGGDVWQWIAGLYGRDAVMAIRRELDGQAGVLNLLHLLHDMEHHAGILTRARYRAFLPDSTRFPAGFIDLQFERLGGPPGPGTLDDHVRGDVIAKDRAALQRETRVVFEYAQRLVAHRTSVGELSLTLREVDSAMQAVFRCLRKYYDLLTGAFLAGPTPVPQFDWLAPFRFSWIGVLRSAARLVESDIRATAP